MSTSQKVRLDRPPQITLERPRGPAWIVTLAVVLAASLIGLATWFAIDEAAETKPATALDEQQATALADDLVAAITAGDTDSIRAIYAPTIVHRDEIAGTTERGIEEMLQKVEGYHDMLAFVVERSGPVITIGDTAAYPIRYGNATGGMTPALVVMQVVDGKIVRETVAAIEGVEVTG